MSTGGALGSELAKFAAGIEVQGMGDFAHSPPQLIEAILNKQFQDLQERGRDPTRALTHTRVLYARPTAPHLAPPRPTSPHLPRRRLPRTRHVLAASLSRWRTSPPSLPHRRDLPSR